jgi:reductive dehalogenase
MQPGLGDGMQLITLGIGILFALTLLWAAGASVREREPRAAAVFLLCGLALPLPYFVVGLIQFNGGAVVAWLLVSAAAVAAAVLLTPVHQHRPRLPDAPTGRIDERDTMFSRRLLVPGTDRFEEHYRRRPEQHAPDDAFRLEPGLLATGTTAHDPVLFGAADASFTTIEQLRPHVDGPPAATRDPVDPRRMTDFLTRWAVKLGAVSAGVTHLEEYHLYSTIGRGPDYGRPVTLDHPFAIAVTVEMDRTALTHAPLAPTVMESAQQYVASGVIALQLAALIRSLGYHARAHIDGNYRVVCPLVARDAGLGEIGRMGLLMTPELGPRVRIAVVTTDLPLLPDERRHDETVLEFCRRCRKCADVCPSGAIPSGDRQCIEGAYRWRIDSEACFTFWCRVGTDCARCVATCPYSHPDTLLHRLVRWGIRRSSLALRGAVAADDLFYGKRPPPRSIPSWMRAASSTAPAGRVAGGRPLTRDSDRDATQRSAS